MSTRRLPSTVSVAAALGLSAVAGIGISVANAAAADGDQQYTGCLKNGTLSNVAIGTQPTAKCPTGATVVTWNEQGPQGEAGAPGSPGEAVTNVWSGVQQPRFVYLNEERTEAAVVTVDAPAGSYRVDGGLVLYAFGENTTVQCDVAGIPAANLLSRPPLDLESSQQLQVTLALTHPGGPIALTCRGGIAEISAGSLVLTRVDALNPGPA